MCGYLPTVWSTRRSRLSFSSKVGRIMSTSHIQTWNHASQTGSKFQHGNWLRLMFMADPYQLKPIPPDQLRNESRVGVYSAIAVVVLVVVLAVGVFFATRVFKSEPEPTWNDFPSRIPTPAKRGQTEKTCINRWLWENELGKYSDLHTSRDACVWIWDRLAACYHEEKKQWSEEVRPLWFEFKIDAELMQNLFGYAVASPSSMDEPGWRNSVFLSLDRTTEALTKWHTIDAPSVVADAHASIGAALDSITHSDQALRGAIAESDATRLEAVGSAALAKSSKRLADAEASLEAWSHHCE